MLENIAKSKRTSTILAISCDDDNEIVDAVIVINISIIFTIVIIIVMALSTASA